MPESLSIFTIFYSSGISLNCVDKPFGICLIYQIPVISPGEEQCAVIPLHGISFEQVKLYPLNPSKIDNLSEVEIHGPGGGQIDIGIEQTQNRIDIRGFTTAAVFRDT
jgi:hypothetical protein